MSWNVKYPSSLREAAKAKGRGVFAFGCDCASGRYEQVGQIDHALASALFRFVARLYSGEVPAEAFAAVEWPGPNSVGEVLRAEKEGRPAR